MKNTTERDELVFYLWKEEKLDFGQIAEREIPGALSLKRIRNIVYGGKGRLKSDFEKEIYSLYRLTFLETTDVGRAILFVYENQPASRLSEPTIRRIVNKMLRRNRINKKNSCKQNTGQA